MPQFPLCSEFIPLLDTVKNQLTELKNLSQEFLRLGDKSKVEDFQQKYVELGKIKQRLADLKEHPVEFEGNQISRIEKELLIFFRDKLDADLRYQSADGDLRYKVDGNRVVMISFFNSYASPKRMTSALEFVRLFTKLQVFDCSKTATTVLPELPQSLQKLYCSKVRITTLPKLPDNLWGLYCSNNSISSLPELPQNLRQLDCSSTQITVLPELPQSLQWLDCRDTPAFQKIETDEQLGAFARQHPGFLYLDP